MSGSLFKKEVQEKNGCRNMIGASQMRREFNYHNGLSALETQEVIKQQGVVSFHHSMDSNVSPQPPPAV
jgi:hypothetical protein